MIDYVLIEKLLHYARSKHRSRSHPPLRIDQCFLLVDHICRSFDPGFMNTAVCESRITFIDGDKGILRYRGYNIEDLAMNSTFMEVAFLLINGALPTKKQLDFWNMRISRHTYLHENLIQLLKTFRYDAHPMGMLISSIAALSTFFPDANPALQGTTLYKSEATRNKQIFRILGKVPTIAACAYRHRIGRPYNQPNNELSYTENFLYMLDHLNEDYRPHPTLSRALDILFILHADHELNCSTAAMRHLSSSDVDPYTALAGAAGALYGPLHGGACQAVLQMLESIGKKENIPKFIEDVKNKKAMLMGFGHRIYKSYDPRAKIVKQLAEQVFALLGKEPLIEVAKELESIALSDEYFITRKLYPNVDFYTGLIYKAMGFPTDYFPVLFAIPRTAGWLAHWVESLNDKSTKIYRPRQIYLGHGERRYVKIDYRGPSQETRPMDSSISAMSRRRDASVSNIPQQITL
eukprot:GEZU01021596.1.p1 GENE.GEZU01021596.1~~GEZU01021596.1.p1  ORF type:complete len:464 (+),score=160.99 GEZU01021596.1:435-1826(+)